MLSVWYKRSPQRFIIFKLNEIIYFPYNSNSSLWKSPLGVKEDGTNISVNGTVWTIATAEVSEQLFSSTTKT